MLREKGEKKEVRKRRFVKEEMRREGKERENKKRVWVNISEGGKGL